MNELKEEIQERHNEVIAFNEDLRESAISETEIEIQQLTNQVFSLHNKLENLHAHAKSAVSIGWKNCNHKFNKRKDQ